MVFASDTWARERGLKTKKGWEIRMTLLTTGQPPGDVLPGARGSWFWLLVGDGLWWVDTNSNHKRCSVSIGRDGKEQRHYSSWPLPTPELSAISAWLRAAEEEAGVVFRRDVPRIESRIAGGKPAAAAWLAAL